MSDRIPAANTNDLASPDQPRAQGPRFPALRAPKARPEARRLDRGVPAAIFLGGTAGALARVWLGQHFVSAALHWPWAIFAINISGSFMLAYLATRLQERLPPSTYRSPLLSTGFCGAYTTFSTVQVEVLTMLEHHRYGLALGYTTASITAGYTAIWFATAAARRTRAIR